MNKNIILLLTAFTSLVSTFSSCQTETIKEVDICIYGGTSAGVIAAYTAKQYGKSVLLIEPGKHIGGLSAGGLGFTDIGNKYVVQGLALDFYRRIGKHYGKLEQWIFEPHVAENIFKDYIKKAEVDILYNHRIVNANKKAENITDITVEDSRNPRTSTNQKVRAKIFIDCSYEGDLMARAGVSYNVGREANSLYNETYNGVQVMSGHQLPDGIDPYIIKGDPSSGLIYGVKPDSVLPAGTGDKKVQAYNYRICLTNVPDNRIPITKPDNYDPSRYELLLRLKEIWKWKTQGDVFIWCTMPNGKTDINNKGGFSTDVIGENWNYPEADYEERTQILKFHEDYTKGLLYFIGHDKRIPEDIRQQMQEWGYPKDEYTDNNHWTPWLYIRESRRMIGELVMTQNHCQGREVVQDGIGWAAYTMDSHNCSRHVINGMVKNEGNVEIGGFEPYPIAYRSLTPKRTEAGNLLVPVCLSASHIAYGSIRMEPVFMVLGQSAAIAACQAIDKHQNIVQNVSAKCVWKEFINNPLADNSPPDIVIDNNNSECVTVTGNWRTEADKWKAYGENFYAIEPETQGKVRYTPIIHQNGNYDIYLYYIKTKKGSNHTTVNVNDGNAIHDITIHASDIIIEGQTVSDWVHIGNFQLSAQKNMYVEITNKDSDGTVLADAILLVPQK